MFPSLFKKATTKLKDLFSKPVFKQEPPKAQVYELEAHEAQVEPDRIVPTKAYADQRQKAPRNRRRKPSKAMRNLYQLR